MTVDGTDFFAVYEAAREMIERAREGGGPTLLEMKMRFFGHFEGDAQTYRGPAKSSSRGRAGLHQGFASRVSEAGGSPADFEAIDDDVAPDRRRRDCGGGGAAARPPPTS